MAISLSETVQAATESVGKLNLKAQLNGNGHANGNNGVNADGNPKELDKVSAEVASQSKLVDPYHYVVSTCSSATRGARVRYAAGTPCAQTISDLTHTQMSRIPWEDRLLRMPGLDASLRTAVLQDHS